MRAARAGEDASLRAPAARCGAAGGERSDALEVVEKALTAPSAVTLRPHFAKLGGAAATFLISLSTPRTVPGDVGLRPPARDRRRLARRHRHTALTPDQLADERWFLHVVESVS